MIPSPMQVLAAWVSSRLRLMVTKAPKDAPLLLIFVLLLGVLILLLYTFASQTDFGLVSVHLG